jgi:hypothetical protein
MKQDVIRLCITVFLLGLACGAAPFYIAWMRQKEMYRNLKLGWDAYWDAKMETIQKQNAVIKSRAIENEKQSLRGMVLGIASKTGG